MRVSCPHCGKQLKISEAIRANIDALGPGQQIRVKCVQCERPFGIDAATGGKSAPGAVNRRNANGGRPSVVVRPPDPPDISWLKDGAFEEKEAVEEVPRALLLMPDISGRESVIKDLEKIGYRVEMAGTAEEAMGKMQFVNFAAVIFHSRFEEKGIHGGDFHMFMQSMNMSRRRYIFYVLIGEEFKTLYDLQALTASANLVVNDADIPHFSLLLRKTIPEYEALFGPLMEELRLAGR
jgi:hypothetical protein